MAADWKVSPGEDRAHNGEPGKIAQDNRADPRTDLPQSLWLTDSPSAKGLAWETSRKLSFHLCFTCLRGVTGRIEARLTLPLRARKRKDGEGLRLFAGRPGSATEPGAAVAAANAQRIVIFAMYNHPSDGYLCSEGWNAGGFPSRVRFRIWIRSQMANRRADPSDQSVPKVFSPSGAAFLSR